jgi:hypothetical protein
MKQVPTQFDWIYQLYLQEQLSKTPIDQREKLLPTDFYWENGHMVMTDTYHSRRGSCCGNGCRHCPYEPKHSKGITNIFIKNEK